VHLLVSEQYIDSIMHGATIEALIVFMYKRISYTYPRSLEACRLLLAVYRHE